MDVRPHHRELLRLRLGWLPHKIARPCAQAAPAEDQHGTKTPTGRIHLRTLPPSPSRPRPLRPPSSLLQRPRGSLPFSLPAPPRKDPHVDARRLNTTASP